MRYPDIVKPTSALLLYKNEFWHMYRPDRTDWKIIALLNEDGRMSSAEIARQLGDVSARSVSNRINALTAAKSAEIKSAMSVTKLSASLMTG